MSRVNAAFDVATAPIDCDMFIFLPLNPFLKMFADLTFLFLSSLFLKCMKANGKGSAGHSAVVQLLVQLSPHETLLLRLYDGSGLLQLCGILQFSFCLALPSWSFHLHIFSFSLVEFIPRI